MAYKKPKSKTVVKGVGVKKTKKVYAACGDCTRSVDMRCTGGYELISA